jgi:hypothetical protein
MVGFGSSFEGGFWCANANFVDFEATQSRNHECIPGVVIRRYSMRGKLQLHVLDLWLYVKGNIVILRAVFAAGGIMSASQQWILQRSCECNGRTN